jgi:hypothetical protein
MKNSLKFVSILSFPALFPIFAFAFNTDPCVAAPKGIGALLCNFQQILNLVVPVLVALGVVYFVWGVVQYVIMDSEEAKKKGKDRMIFGIIGFVVIIGLWGLVTIVTDTFGTGEGVAPSNGQLQDLLPK